MSSPAPAIADGHNLSAAYPRGIRWDIDIPHIDLARVADEAVVKFGRRPAIDFKGKKISYAELGELISRAAKGLQDIGVDKGTRVGLCMPNTPYYPIMFFAALKLGATIVNFSPLYTKEELRAQIRDSGTSVMVTLDLKDFQDRATDLLNEGELKNVISCPFSGMLPFFKSAAFRLFRSNEIAARADSREIVGFRSLTDNDGTHRTAVIDANDTAVLQYTGGTTGTPKGAMLSHFNLVANCHQIEEFFGSGPGKPDEDSLIRPGEGRVLAAIPYFHVFGMMVSLIAALKSGAELVIMPNPRDIKDVLKTIHKKQPTLFPAVPRLLQAMTEDGAAKGYDLGSLKTIMSGGAALSPALAESFEKAAGKPGLIKQGYGLTETSPVVTSMPPYGLQKKDSVGMPYPRTEVKIADPEDPARALAIGEIGEICLRGPQVMKGYYNKPDETAKILTPDGWLLSGDLGYLDEDLYLHIVDRKKRMVIINGYKVFPNQLEKVVSQHPSVAECVVVSVPDKSSGEAAKIFVRLRSDAQTLPSETELRQWLAPKISRIEMPKYFEFVTQELPKTAVGKPDWKTLQDQERSRFQKNIPPPPKME